MKKPTKRLLIVAAITLVLLAGTAVATAYWLLLAPQFHPNGTAYVYIDSDDTADSVFYKVQAAGHPRCMTGFRWLAAYKKYDAHIRTGRYAIRPGEDAYHVLGRLRHGYQEPTNLVVGNPRTLDRLAAGVARQLMTDSASIASLLLSPDLPARLGCTPQEVPAYFLPDTYQVYWDMTAEDFLTRMQQEHARFWNAERRRKAQALGLTPAQVATLASIVEEETNAAAERPDVAGLYLNRLKRGMLLQADPTVKFAWQDFSLRRITHAHLQIDSPYNTYRYPGLPPGPIRIATPAGIDAVLNHTQHDYLYMCAKEDFSGTHRFATNYHEHLRNARRYQEALNKRKIFR